LEITKKEVEKLIELKEENSFINHLWTVFYRDFRVKGEISYNKIKLWKQGFWNMTLYPVFTFEFNAEMHLINITDKQNPIGKFLRIIILLTLVILFFVQLINNFRLITNWRFIALFGILIWLSNLLFQKVYKNDKQNQLDKIYWP
jgi:hypothetical protein